MKKKGSSFDFIKNLQGQPYRFFIYKENTYGIKFPTTAQYLLNGNSLFTGPGIQGYELKN